MAFKNISFFFFYLITIFSFSLFTPSFSTPHGFRLGRRTSTSSFQLQMSIPWLTTPFQTPNNPKPQTTSSPSPSPSPSPSHQMTAPPSPDNSSGGDWVLLHKSVGISAMHMQLLYNNKVLIFDRTDFGVSNLSLPQGKCRQNDAVVKQDCSAHSLLYDVASNTYRPLMVQTNVWCSSGSLHADGTLIQTGGFRSGEKRVRLFSPCDDSQNCDWVELPEGLLVRRWYASNHILPDGRIIIVGGRRQFNYEFFPKNTPNGNQTQLYSLPFLKITTDRFEENNLYPFLYLLPDGYLYIFANRRSISFDYINSRVIREFPAIPGEKRNYPSTGSSVLLPLRSQSPEAEVLICGGAPNLAYYKADNQSVFVEASKTCGRLKLTDPDPHWVMENMPMSRVMGDMVLLPTGDIIIINGASNGSAGWEDAVGAVLTPLLYVPTQQDPTRRFTQLKPATIPRMYHSSAILLPDGRILVGGSNPHMKYNFTAMPYPTDLSLEAFLPPYMGPQYSDLRPSISSVEPDNKVLSYGQKFSVTFKLVGYRPDQVITVPLIAPPFQTHSFGMNQRMIYLAVVGGVQRISEFEYKIDVISPSTSNVAPPGYYMLFVVYGGIPGQCAWIKVNN